MTNALNLLAVEDPPIGSRVGKVQSQGDRGWITLVGLSRDRQIDMGQAQRRIDNAISRRRGPPLTSQDLLEDAACFPLKHFLQRSADRQGLPLAAGVLIGELRLCDTGVGSKLDG